jgi:hypothetical protein
MGITMKKILNLFILDASTSMRSIKRQIIDGYNKQLSVIKEQSGEDIDSRVSLVTFRGPGYKPTNSYGIETKFSDVKISEVEHINDEIYVCDGSTPMLDAIGISIKETDKLLGGNINDVDVIVTILTDGEENSSNKFTGSQIADLIKEYTDTYNWIFNFIGANIDVESIARNLNIPVNNTISFVANEQETSAVVDCYTKSITSYYSAVRKGEDAVCERRLNFMS